MKKEHRGGKYSKQLGANGYFGTNEAGQRHETTTDQWGVRREIGTGSKVFTFYNETHGFLTIRADTFEEAWRLARVRGYSRRNYRKR